MTAFNHQSRIQGLKSYSSRELEKISKNLINDFNPNILNYFRAVPFNELILFLKEKYSLTVQFQRSLPSDAKGHKIWGCYNRKEKNIYIDQSLYETSRFQFVLAHELGHFLLHSYLKINQKVYDSFSDSKYNFRIGKHVLENNRHWIEWRANQFAASLILPEMPLRALVLWYQDKEGIRNKGTIYVDHQLVNRIDFSNIVNLMSNIFGVSKINIIYRLQDIGVRTQSNKLAMLNASANFV